MEYTGATCRHDDYDHNRCTDVARKRKQNLTSYSNINKHRGQKSIANTSALKAESGTTVSVICSKHYFLPIFSMGPSEIWKKLSGRGAYGKVRSGSQGVSYAKK